MSSETKRGRPAKQIPKVADDAVYYIRGIVKEYRELRDFCGWIPKRRQSLFRRLNIHTTEYEETGDISYDREVVDRIPERDRKVVLSYADAMKKVWILEHGIASIKDDRTRSIAEDTLLKGKRVEDLAREYGISGRAVWQRKRESIIRIADFATSGI